MQLNNFAVGLSTSPFIEASDFGTFIFFGAVSIVAILWVWIVLPETKGRTLEEMDELFGEAGFAEADLSLKQRIEREIGLTSLLYGDAEGNVDGTAEKSKATSMLEGVNEKPSSLLVDQA